VNNTAAFTALVISKSDINITSKELLAIFINMTALIVLLSPCKLIDTIVNSEIHIIEVAMEDRRGANSFLLKI
jgi:hypothetical protein